LLLFVIIELCSFFLAFFLCSRMLQQLQEFFFQLLIQDIKL
jgi:hypothetical protein